MKKILYGFLICCFCLFYLLSFSATFVGAKVIDNSFLCDKSEYNCTCKSICVIEQNSKRVMLSKNKNESLPMASTTKIMTCLVALENCNKIDEKFVMDNRAVGIEGTSIYIKKDEVLSMRDLLYGLMLASGNDCAVAIAYKIGNGELNKFVDMMNEKANSLELKNTHFDNPHGLDSDTHYTSSYDLAVITAEAMKNETFREIVGSKNRKICSSFENYDRFVRNKHKLLGVMDGCEGVKTGFTDNARRCVVTSVKRGNLRLICVVLNCNDMFEESQKALELCFENFNYSQILEPYKIIGEIAVNNGVKENVKLYSQKQFSYPILEDEKDNFDIKYDYEKTINAPTKKDDILGTVKIYFNGECVFDENIYVLEDIEQKDVLDKVQDIIGEWYL